MVKNETNVSENVAEKEAQKEEQESTWEIVGWGNFTKSKKAIQISYNKEIIGCVSINSLSEMLNGQRDKVAICTPTQKI